MISLDKYNGITMFLMNYLLKYGFQAKRKSVNVKVLQIIIIRKE